MSQPDQTPSAATGRELAEREFLAASVAVWREIDRLSEEPGGYKGLPPSTDLRIAEAESWERYKQWLDRPTTCDGTWCDVCKKDTRWQEREDGSWFCLSTIAARAASMAEDRSAARVRYVRSNMGLVHKLAASGQRAVCGAAIRRSWDPVEVADWSSEPNVCRSCDDVVMARGRRAAQ